MKRDFISNWRVGVSQVATIQPTFCVFEKKKHKQSMKCFEPFKILHKLGHVAYKLTFPDGAKIHPMFHVSVLKKFIGNCLTDISPLPMMTDSFGFLIQLEQLLQVHTILHNQRSVKQSWVQWNGLPPYENPWEDLLLLQ